MLALLLVVALQDPVSTLIERFKSDEIRERDEASAELEKRGEAVLAEIEAARKGADKETLARIEELITRIRCWEYTVVFDRRAVNLRTGDEAWKDAKRGNRHSQDSATAAHDAFLLAPDGTLERRAIRDGRVLWTSKPFDAADLLYQRSAWSPELHVLGGVVLAVAQKRIRAFDPATGAETWSIALALGEMQSPMRGVVGDAKSFLLLSNSQVDCFDLATGKVRWTLKERGNAAVFLPAGDPVVVGDRAVRRLDGATGQSAWKFDGDCRGRLAFLAGGAVVAGTAALDPKNGTALWRVEGCAPLSAAVEGTTLFVALADEERKTHTIAAVDTTTWKEIWTSSYEMNGVSLAAADGRLYVCEYHPWSCSVGLSALDGKTGRTAWRAKVDGISVEHSKYSHEAKLAVWREHVAVLGRASAGTYVETFNAKDGSIIRRWKE